MFVRLLKLGQLAFRHKLNFVATLCRIILRTLYACDIPGAAKVADSVVFAHSGLGTVINAGVSIGENTIVHHHVTIGKIRPNGGVPIIMNDCYIGTGAIILGEITIGEHAKIGAGSVVIHDVMPYTTVAGVPAKVVKTVGR